MAEDDRGTARSIEGVPRLVSAAAHVHPGGFALGFDGIVVTFGELNDAFVRLDAQMGGVLGPESLVTLVFTELFPGAFANADGALERAVAGLLHSASSVVDAQTLLEPDRAGPERPTTLVDAFEASVDRAPDAVALVAGDERITYMELDLRANRVARNLVAAGVGPDRTVGVALRRSVDLVVALYGVLKAGGAYVPLDPDHPVDRVRYVIEIAQPLVVIADANTSRQLTALEPSERDEPKPGKPKPGKPTLGVPILDMRALEAGQNDAPRIQPADRVVVLHADHLAYVIFTSGSTGRPKGVAVAHSAVQTNLRWRQQHYELSPDDVVLQKTPFTFDVSVWEFFWPLQVGARLVLAEPDGHLDPRSLAKTIRSERVTVVHFVPSMLAVFVDEPDVRALPSLRYVFASGEELTAAGRSRFAAVSDAQLHNLYGPTEAAIDVTHHHAVDDGGAHVPIGVPVADTQTYVLDSGLGPVPPNSVGELYVAGKQLARGYVSRPQITAERFVADPFVPGTRMYRTGDLVRRATSGQLIYVGRSDFQIKLRGLRIELGEIEAVLYEHDSVSQCAVVQRDQRLVGYVVPTHGTTPDLDRIRATLRRSLPDYMVPSALVVLERMPLGSSGKLDRTALPDPAETRSAFSAPVTETEQAVAQLFGHVLGVGAVGRTDDFFALGGNSLDATRLVSRLNARFAVDIAVRDFFDHSTVDACASSIDAAPDSRTVPIPLVARDWPHRIPLSPAQQRMWFLSRLDPHSSVDNIALAIRLSGPLDVEALTAAIVDVVSRHASLRTSYPETDGVGFQAVAAIDDVHIDWAVNVASASAIAERITSAIEEPFDFAVSPPFRVRLIAVEHAVEHAHDRAEHVLVVVVHHIAADGFSMGPLSRDIMLAYSGRAAGQRPSFVPLQVQYPDYTLWQRDVLGTPDDPTSTVSLQERYWRSALAGMPDRLELPTDRVRPHVWSSRGARHVCSIDAETHRRLLDVGRQSGSTAFMVVHAALAVLLSRVSGSGDVAVGTPVAGRGEAVLDDVIGMFVNTLVLRCSVDGGSSFADVLAGVREVDLSAFAHADVPFERVVEVVDPPRMQGVHPLIQVMLTFRDVGSPAVELDGLTIDTVDIDLVMAKLDLDFSIDENRSDTGEPLGMTVAITYATGVFDAESVVRLGDGFVAVLAAVLSDPLVPVGDIDLSGSEERALLAGVNDTACDIEESATLVSLFAAQVAATPDAVAVTFEGVSLTYAEFDARSNSVARALIGRGVGTESLVALALRRSLDLLVGLYGVVKAGAGYVPVDPDQPADRVGYILDTSGVALVLTTSRDGFTADDVTVVRLEEIDGYSDAAVSDSDRFGVLRPENAAYVLFTSGSTGRPKGVSISHRAIVNRLVWMQEQYGLRGDDVVVQKTPVTFDVSVWELFWPLQVGARLVVAKPDGHRDPVYLAELMRAEDVSVAHFVPSMLAVFAAEPAAAGARSLRWVFASGEALPVSTARLTAAVLPSARLVNLYGPTEAAVDVTYHEFTAGEGSVVPIGRPVFNTRVHVLDGRLRSVPVGMVGELYLAGVQLARGYHGRPDLTADRFVADPFTAGRLYRTGDLVRWMSSGELEYIGRSDFQVKLRGLRIELGEVESALLTEESVSQAVVLVRRDQLVAYVVPAAGTSVDVDALLRSTATLVPEYMVPAMVLVLEALPLGPSGKLDRKALPEPVFAVREFREPVSDVERVVAGVFGEVLGFERVGLDDDFFELGGNSLIATQVVSRVGAALDASVPVRAVFDHPDVVGLAAFVDSVGGTGGRAPLVAGRRPRRVPLSLAQQRMWFLDRFDPQSAAYNIPIVVRLGGGIDVTALTQAIDDVRERHESLRTIYPDFDGVGYQVVLPLRSRPIDLGVTQCTETEALRLIRDSVAEHFDLADSPPFRAHLYRLDTSEDILAVVVHHIASDGFSMGPLMRDIVAAYAARSAGSTPAWTPLPVQYADYAVWQREVLGDESDPNSIVSEQIDFWTRVLEGVPEQLDLPTDRPRPTKATEEGAVHAFEIDSRLHRSIVTLGRDLGCTPFMIVHTAFALLLARVADTDDVVIGTPVAGRGDKVLDDVVGMFVNTLVLRTPVPSSATVRELLMSVREIDIDAFAHAEIPFERLVEILDPPRSTARQPLFQVMLAFQNLERTTVELPEIDMPEIDLAGVEVETGLSKFDLYLTVSENFDDAKRPVGMRAEFLYLTALFDETTIADFGRRLIAVLDAIIDDDTAVVGDINILTGDERRRASGRTRPGAPATNETLLDRYRAQVAARPDSVAVSFGDESLTYAEFDSRVKKVVSHLLSAGVGAETTVAVALPRSFDMLVAIYAVVSAGAAYVPVDPTQPAARIRHILDNASVSVVLVSSTTDFDRERSEVDVVVVGEVLNSEEPSSSLTRAGAQPHIDTHNAAYVLYTSGSTGIPKGVVISHRAIVNRLNWMQSEYQLECDDVVVQKTPVTFDVSVWELFWPLQVGARLVLAAPDGHRDPSYLAHLFRTESVTVAHFVPSMLAVFVQHPEARGLEALRQVFASGEELPVSTARGVREALPTTRMINLYGPTEAAVDVTQHEYVASDMAAVPIGRPVPGADAHVLDGRLHPVVTGAVGELYLSGVQLARGYVHRPDLTAERFVADPFDDRGGRLYRTGDLVRRDHNDELVYVGRADFQVKLRGQRIELGEIESALSAHPAVVQAVVVLVSKAHIGDVLVGYVVQSPGATVDTTDLRETVAAAIPDYMVPSSIVVLNELPVGPNGKLDRAALPDPIFGVHTFRPPSTPVEKTVAGVYGDLLGAENVGLDDDFFELGGNSLVATRAAARLGRSLGSQVPLRTLFEAPRVEALAALIENQLASGSRPALERQGRDGPIPLSLAQQRMWFANRLEPYSAANNVPVAIRLSGELDIDALAAAFADVVARHDILRTRYPDIDGVGMQEIEPVATHTVAFTVVECGREDTPARVSESVGTGFDVTVDVPVQATLLRESRAEHVLVVVAHHISVDGFSIGPLTRDLVRSYSARVVGDRPGWGAPAVQYADYAVWQRRTLGSDLDPSSIVSAQIDYWTEQLTDMSAYAELPSDRPRPGKRSRTGARTSIVVDPKLRSRITTFAHREGATPFMVMHSALAVLLARLCDTDDVALGTPIAGRGDEELDDMIGMFVNTLVLRTQIDLTATFGGIVSGVRETDLSAFANSDIPFEQVVELVDPPRVAGRTPLFQVMFAFQNIDDVRLDMPGLTISSMEFDAGQAAFDLQVTVSDSQVRDQPPSWGIEFLYATDLFDHATAERFAAAFVRLLSGLMDAPNRAVGDVELLSPDDRNTIVSKWSGSGPVASRAVESNAASTLVERFAEAVVANPDKVAVRFGGESFTYAEISRRVDVVARHLVTIGAEPDSLIAVALPRSVELVVAVLAVSRSGAAYLPIDPTYPADRIEFILEDAKPIAVLASEPTAGFGSIPVVDLATLDPNVVDPTGSIATRVASRPDNLAYVIYTSGSTGTPKGVAITQGNAVSLFTNTAGVFGFDHEDVWTLFHSYAFDFSVWEMWGSLIHGGTLVIVDYDTSRSPELFRELLVAEKVTVLNQTPSAFHQLALHQHADAGGDRPPPLSLRCIIFGGEALDPRRLRSWISRFGDGTAGTESSTSSDGPMLVNMYGITETTVHVSFRQITERDAHLPASSIGIPVAGLRVYVLDRRLRPVPVGVAGEMYVAGAQVARGYLGKPGLSATRFVPDPFQAGGSTLYRTGDRARWVQTEAGGELEYLGRTDDQVKVRGFRIEIGEVEAAVSAQPDVRDVAVIVRDDPSLGPTLVAYVVSADGASLDANVLRADVSTVLPAYMVPSLFVSVDAIPLTVNGKLDRRALPDPRFTESAYRAPAGRVEVAVARVFADVLGRDRIGAGDDFFLLGGNSLVATRVASRLGAALDAPVTVRMLFEASTVSDLAARLHVLVGTGADRALTARTRPTVIPLSYAQQRMWLLNRLNPGSSAYDISLALRLEGHLDTDALASAVGDVISRHETLRTVYPEIDGVGSQKVLLHADAVFSSESIRYEDAADRVRALLRTPFDVTVEVPVLVRLLELSSLEHILVLVVHHIAADGFSLGPLTRDLMTAYAARAEGYPPAWEPLEIDYADYVLWHRDVLGDAADPTSSLAAQEAYWQGALADLPEQRGLGTDRPRSKIPTRRGAEHEFLVPRALVESLESTARDHNATLFMVLHVAVAVVLARTSGEDDVAIGTPVAGRGQPALDDVVGMFVNTLVLRSSIPDDSLSTALRITRESDLDAFAHSDVPFDRVVELLDPPRSTARSPFFDVVVALQNHSTSDLELPGLSISGLGTAEPEANHDLQLVVSDAGDGSLTCAVVYAADLFEKATVVMFCDRVLRVLHALASAPHTHVQDIDLDVAPAPEPPATPHVHPSSAQASQLPHLLTVAGLLDSSVEADTEGPAVFADGSEWTYSSLSARSAQLGRYLVSRGIGPGDRVRVDLPWSADCVTALWAVWCAGAAVVSWAPGNVAVPAAAARIVLGTDCSGTDTDMVSIVFDSSVVAEAVASQPSSPIGYASRTRALSSEDPALVVGHGDIVLSQRELVSLASRYTTDWTVDYDSRLIVEGRSSITSSSSWECLAVLVAASAGAEISVARIQQDDGTTHAVVPSTRVAEVIDLGVETVVSTDSDRGAPWSSGS